MSTTAEQVFQIAMAIADEIPDSGSFTSSDMTSYKVRTPYILTMLEAELLKNGEIFNTYTITDDEAPFSTASTDDYWITIAMPSDFKQLKEIITMDTDGRYVEVNFRWQDKNNLVFPAQFEGTLTIVYYAIPTVISALTDTLHVDDVTARTLLPYALTSELFKTEDETIYQYANARYQQLKQSAKQAVQFGDIADYYG